MIQRTIVLNNLSQTSGTVIYWMSRDQRVYDNWALLYAQSKALEMNQALVVVFCKCEGYLGSTEQLDNFMMKGLHEVSAELNKYQIPFVVLEGDPVENILSFSCRVKAGLMITDFNPLKLSREWKMQVAQRLDARFVEVDAHNVIPCFTVSNKQEFSARTFRPKVHSRLDEFLTDFPVIVKHPFQSALASCDLTANFAATEKALRVEAPFHIESGEIAAKAHLKGFIANRLHHYNNRNDPNIEACSGLSPYLHFGQISAQRITLEIMRNTDDASEFLEELIVRRELADNFCYYNKNYNSPDGFPEWARKTLDVHRLDHRDYIYSIEQLIHATTHDLLWNAAQMEMVKTGHMHGYLRMYWAKKILEWSLTAEQAMRNAIYLNDRYQLDGRDPNGYTGIAWSIGGVHDRAWGERSVFGKIRYMSYAGCKRKFDVAQYIQRINSL